MAAEYSLYMQKTKDESEVKSSLGDFGFVVCQIPWPDEVAQELASRKWPGLHGEDTYIPPAGLRLEAYDLEVEFCYKGPVKSAYAAYKALRTYLMGLSGDGAELRIFDPYWDKGRAGVYVKKFGDLEAHRSNIDEVFLTNVTFRIPDPMTEVVMRYNSNGETINLETL